MNRLYPDLAMTDEKITLETQQLSTILTQLSIKPNDVDAIIYDIQGKVVRKLVHRSRLVGSHNMTWDATNNKGLAVSAGIYFYTLEFDDIAKTMKMLLVK